MGCRIPSPEDAEKPGKDTMKVWNHLFLGGEFCPRERLLSGLTLEQVSRCPPGASHSIFEELWHATSWQRIVVEHEQVEAQNYPSRAPESEQVWHELVQAFLTGAAKAVAVAESPDELSAETEPGMTMEDELCSLAVHNAYHLGKIVALRQMMGAWPPKST